MPVQASTEPQVQLAITAAPVELGDWGIKMSSSQAARVAVEAVAQGQEGWAEMATMGAGRICAYSLTLRADLAVPVVREEAVQADKEGI